MEVVEFAEMIVKKPYLLRMGRGKLSKRYGLSPEDVVKAKNLSKSRAYNSFPKILIFDVETAPMKAYVWGRWQQNISLEATISEWFMLCWSAKWLYSDDVISDRLTSQEALAEDDSRLVKNLWKLIDECDVLVAYNGKKADVKWMNSRFIVHGLNPPKPYFMIDPCEVAKKSFGFSSNKLDALAGYFKIPHKLDTDFNLWKRSVEGDGGALEYMRRYNEVDVKILEEVYLRMRPWIVGHPNCGNIIDSPIPTCSICASKDLEELEGKFYYTSVGKYQLYRCKDCGSVSRGRINLNKGINTIVSVGK